ncbi:MAG: hypothetical protein M1497_08750 [Nitrospirae bacterium]|nr:hypothetical protein [Nitrospirota bacterium]
MKKLLLCSALLLGLLSLLPPPALAETFTCLACHSAMKGKVRTDKGSFIEVNIDEQRFSKSVHGGMGCTACHKTFKDNPHERPQADVSRKISELANLVSPKAKVDSVAYAACDDCHGEIYKKVSESIHGKNVIEKRQHDGALCLDCHGSPHYIMPQKSKESMVNRSSVVKTCGECHENEEIAKKYNLGTQIVEKYEESFHGKKYRLGHPGVPTCVSCHGAHDIRKWDDPASPVSWEKRTITCGKCHPGANRRFVASITHKPVGKDNPIPYYAEKGLIVLTMGTIAFVIFHVFLEALADIRDRVFRKKKEEHHD